jgi:uracil-DNA glycosylase
VLKGARVTAAVRCAPPENKPTTLERDTCQPFLEREIALTSPRVIVALGAFGWTATLRSLVACRFPVPRPRPRFGHGVEVEIGSVTLLGCYHPSQQNTFTGRLTESMLDDVLLRARALT